VLDHHDRVGAARNHAAGCDRRGGAGHHLDRRLYAAGNYLGVEDEPSRRAVAGARCVRGAHRETVDVGAIERRRIDRRDNISREHAGERVCKQYGFAAERREVDARCETPARFLRGDHFQELLLARSAAHRIDDRRARPLLDFRVYGHRFTAMDLRPWVHGNGRPCCKTFTLGRDSDPTVAVRQGCE
jgi:hypothetical protein